MKSQCLESVPGWYLALLSGHPPRLFRFFPLSNYKPCCRGHWFLYRHTEEKLFETVGPGFYISGV